MLTQYILFENLQQAEKFVQENQVRFYEPLKEFLKSKGKLGWLYLFTVILYESGNNRYSEENYNKIIILLEKIIKHNIKIDADELLKNHKIYKKQISDYLWRQVVTLYKKTITNNFIDKFAPGFLKNDIKKISFKLEEVLFDRQYGVNIMDDIDTELLRGKMSMFKDPAEWIEYVKISKKDNSVDNIKKIKESDEIQIFYENEEWLIYMPKTYESMNLIIYPHWCTIIMEHWKRINHHGFLIVIYNKKEKRNSYVAEFKSNDFRIHNFFDSTVDRPIGGVVDLRKNSKVWKNPKFVEDYVDRMKINKDFTKKVYNDIDKRGVNKSERDIFTVFCSMLSEFKK